uniref:AlNc14C47G3760 protein n=1 Tax=Albugo laibachii Nc14 TaxID=890382 RepID=F0WAP6_9STRA|nr:AlNc14C47G3760 [Albugo laibachii Nc14]|eukprot:CCA18217.1 AlNc14C47G3760 [Albugo laibachii Nc14]
MCGRPNASCNQKWCMKRYWAFREILLLQTQKNTEWSQCVYQKKPIVYINSFYISGMHRDNTNRFPHRRRDFRDHQGNGQSVQQGVSPIRKSLRS